MNNRIKEIIIKVFRLKPEINRIKVEREVEKIIYILDEERDNPSDIDGKGYVLSLYTSGEEIKDAVVEGIKRAKKSLKIAVYNLNQKDIVRAIESKRDFDVRVLVHCEKKNPDKYKEYTGIEGLRLINKSGLFHVKYCIIDDKEVLVGSYNYTETSRKNYECGVYIKGAEAVEKFIKHFKKFEEYEKEYAVIELDKNNYTK